MQVLRRRKFGIILLIIVIIIVTLSAYFLFRPEGRFFLNMKLNHYEDALVIYEESIEGIQTQKVIDNVVLSEIKKLYQQYEKGEIEYTSLCNKYDALKRLESETVIAELDKWQKQADALNASATAYEMAEKYFADSEYDKAYEYYKQVIKEDNNYEEAQKRTEETAKKYKEAVLAELEGYKKAESYEEAVMLLEKGLTVLKNDSDFTQELTLCRENYTDAMLEMTLNEAKEKAEEGNYKEAIIITANAVSQFPDASERIYKLKEAYIEKYLEQTKNEINRLVEEDDYEQAILVCEQAREVLPDDVELFNILEELQEKMPVNLSELKISESGSGYELIAGKEVIEDTIGNVYSPGNVFSISGEWGDGYVKYYLGKEYKKLKLKIAIYDVNENYKKGTMVSFYGDDNVILYTTPYMKRSTSPFNVEIDVEDVEWLYIVATEERRNAHGSVIELLINPVLYK